MVLADSPRSSHKHLTNSLLTFWAFGLYWWKIGTCEGRSNMVERRLKVFISYARSDYRRTHDLYKRLIGDGLDAWIDKEYLLPGQNRELEISKFVRETDVVIVCHSKEFNKDGFHQKEVRLALEVAKEKTEDGIFIIPVRLEECDLLENLRHLQHVDLFLGPRVTDYVYTDYESLLASLRKRANDVGASLPIKQNRPSKVSSRKIKKDRPIYDFLLKNWLIRHGIDANPFGRPDFNSYPFYPDGATRPDKWEVFVAPFPLLAQCPTMEDAKALAYLLKRDHNIFPVWIWPQQTESVQSPFLTLAYSVAHTWLDILPTQPQMFFDLPSEIQNALLELLCWSLGSNEALAHVVRLKSHQRDENIIILLRKISEFNGGFLPTEMPQDRVLLSWLKIRPPDMARTHLLLLGDDLFHILPVKWFKQFAPLIPVLSLDGIDVKLFTSSSLTVSLPLGRIELIWSEQWLKRSLESQFDVALHTEMREMGVAIRFHDLFGPGVTEQETTDKLVFSSNYSLAHMLNLGNRLLQYHCEKRGVFEKYLYVEDLETILNSA